MSLTYDEIDKALTVACADRDTIAADLRAAREEVERLRGELAEAQATIDNERGEGAPPEPGWKWDPDPGAWALGRAWTGGTMMVAPIRPHGWAWGPFGERLTAAPTARAAIRAAAKAVRGES